MYRSGFSKDINELTNLISYCMGYDSGYESSVEERYDFPLIDILFQLYLAAIKNDTVNLNDEISVLLEDYKNVDPDFNYSKEDLIRLGWVENCFGHLHIIGHHRGTDKEDIAERFSRQDDKRIVRFVKWADGQSVHCTKYFLNKHNLEELLEKWRQICDSVPQLQWFINQNYLTEIDDKIYLSEGYGYDRHITKAMGRLWNYICDSREYEKYSKRWFKIAFQTRTMSDFFGLIKNDSDNDNRDKMFSIIYDAIERDAEYLDHDLEARKLFNSYMFSSYQKTELTDDQINEYVSGRYRAFKNENGFLFENSILWNYRKMWGDSFYLGAVLKYMIFAEDRRRSELFQKIKMYSDCDRLGEFRLSLSAEIIYTLMLHKETFYYGVMHIFQNISADRICYKNQIDRCSVGLIKKILEMYVEQDNFPDVYDLLDMQLFLLYRSSTFKHSEDEEDQWYTIYKKLMNLYFTDYFDKIARSAQNYFKKLMELKHSDVNFCICFYLLSQFTDRMIVVEKDKDKLFDALIIETGKAVNKILLQNGNFCHFLNIRCFTEQLCSKIYDKYFCGLSEIEKLEFLLFNYVSDDKYDRSHRYKVCIGFLTRAAKHAVSDDALLMLQELLDKILFEKKLLDFDIIVILRIDSILKEAFNVLERSGEQSKVFFRKMLTSDFSLLLLFTTLCENIEHKNKMIQEIEKRVKDNKNNDILFQKDNDEKLIDCVLDCKIECLFTAVEERLNYKLNLLKKKASFVNNRYYTLADSQKKRLLYLQNRSEELKNCGDNFFIAALKTDSIESSKDYEEVKCLWKQILESKERNRYSFAACYNYLYSVFVILQKMAQGDSKVYVETKSLDEDYLRILDYSIKYEFDNWNEEYQELYIRLALDVCRGLNRELPEMISRIQSSTNLKLDSGRIISIIVDIEKSDSIEDSTEVKLKNDPSLEDESLISSLQKFLLRSLADKTKFIATTKGISISDKDWQGVFLLNSVIICCKMMRNSVPFLISASVGNETAYKKVNGRNGQRPPEDNISILFRECYNMAFGRLFDVYVSDQSKISSTGNVLGALKVLSPGEADMVFYHNGDSCELFEAFVLDGTSKINLFRDHMKKLLANNNKLHSPVFMLIYSFSETNVLKRRWKSYIDYLERTFINDFIYLDRSYRIKSSIANYCDSGCYVQGFTDELDGLEIIRQIVEFEKETIEIFHILIDMSYSMPKDIRMKV